MDSDGRNYNDLVMKPDTYNSIHIYFMLYKHLCSPFTNRNTVNRVDINKMLGFCKYNSQNAGQVASETV